MLRLGSYNRTLECSQGRGSASPSRARRSVGAAVILIGSLFWGAVLAQSFTADLAALYGSFAVDAEVLGTLTLATPVTPTGNVAGDLAEVVVTGWSVTGVDWTVFESAGVRIKKATLTEAGREQRVVGQMVQRGFTPWEEVTITGWVKRSLLVDDLGPLWAQAGELYASACSACHGLFSPTDFGVNEWPGMVTTMIGYADPAFYDPNIEDIGHDTLLSELSGFELDSIIQYLQYNAQSR